MGTWFAVVAVILAVVIGFTIMLRRRIDVPKRQHRVEVYVKMPYRVSWPPGYADSRPIRQVKTPNGLYLMEAFGGRAAALEFLRGCEVRDERVYVIAENPESNLGKDLVMIFEEFDGAFVEIAERSVLPTPELSREDCARCGYAVIPAQSPGSSAITYGDGTVRWFASLDQMEMDGYGHQCQACGALACARCYRSVPQHPNAGGKLDLRCWLCDGRVDVFTG
ncbi:hypothetical protein [Glycomyces buryatensis]|uniref:Uncharacterized protein n=1 Tax=Glycomyces buryatensis TaxID=2570927 RepID=A0A4S8QCB3_9ACTN|nr:hypothetical protein [Glycomyces buryatensis]THV41221.1 hypothetical protein FAB82_12755 [Glycomyces buryatensis]